MLLAQCVCLFNAYSPSASSSACSLDCSRVTGGCERVVLSSRLDTGVSSGTKFGSNLIIRDSEDCDAVKGYPSLSTDFCLGF
jgi:hypothetical protein